MVLFSVNYSRTYRYSKHVLIALVAARQVLRISGLTRLRFQKHDHIDRTFVGNSSTCRSRS